MQSCMRNPLGPSRVLAESSHQVHHFLAIPADEGGNKRGTASQFELLFANLRRRRDTEPTNLNHGQSDLLMSEIRLKSREREKAPYSLQCWANSGGTTTVSSKSFQGTEVHAMVDSL